MRQLATITAAALFATVMGFGGTAWAQTDVLINGGAEAANGGEWVAVGCSRRFSPCPKFLGFPSSTQPALGQLSVLTSFDDTGCLRF